MEIALFDPSGRRKYLSVAETLRFLGEVERLPPRPRLLCLVLIYGGCRVSEALALCPMHVEAGVVTLKTLKRRKTVFRRVPLPEAVTAAMLQLGTSDEERLFPWHRSTAFRLVARLMERAGISGPQACPKGLRHGFGMRMAGAQVPTNLVQRWLGHASLMTTAIYLEAAGAEERGFAARGWQALRRGD